MSEQPSVQTDSKAPAAAFPLKAILGQKVGMTQIFAANGERIPVTVIYTGGCVTTCVKTVGTDGYNAVQIGMGDCNVKKLPKSYVKSFEKIQLAPVKWLREFRIEHPEKFQVGQAVPPTIFSPGDYVDVSGTSKGKGFAGVMKRHNFSGLPNSHGASDKVRSRGSSGGGSGQPQRVFKGTGMAGRMGSDWITTQKLEVVKVDADQHLLLVRGAVPGVPQGLVVVRETSRKLKHRREVVVTKSTKKAAVAKKAPAKAPAAAPKK